MCGITGFISNSATTDQIEHSIKCILHRGPDANGYVAGKLGNTSYGFGHVRLSIIDLDERANQPMTAGAARYLLTYNGELYNFRDLRTELEALGCRFHTQSDSEVLLQAFIQWGEDAFTRLQGIFAAAILDRETETLYLLRDQMGIKPLYYHLSSNGDLFFASELPGLFAYNAVPRTISEADIYEFLNSGFVWEPRTGFENIQKVELGGFAVFRKGRLDRKIYFTPDKGPVSADTTQVRSRIHAACEQQLISDVPLALLFSGGTDSTIIANETRGKAQALFMRYGDGELTEAGMVDDSAYVKAISERLGMTTTVVDFSTTHHNPQEFLSKVREIAGKTGEPVSDFTYAASEDICALARERGIKVVLSGMGGDEAFAGYSRHLLVYFLKNKSFLTPLLRAARPTIRKLPRLSKKASRLLSYLEEEEFALAYCRTVGYFSDEELQALVPDHNRKKTAFLKRLNALIAPLGNVSRLKKALRLDYHGFLAHNLTIADRSSMRVAVEMRVPLLDHELYSMATHLPDRDLLKACRTKSVLKGFLKSVLGKTLANRPKTGFNPPLDAHINAMGKETLFDLLTNVTMKRYLNTSALTRLLNDHFSKRENNTYKIWQLLYLRCWLDHWDTGI